MIKKILIVIGAVLGLIVAVMAVSWFGTSGARDQADKLIAAIRDGDEAALGALVSRELAEKASPGKLLRLAHAWRLDEAQKLTWKTWSYGTGGAKLAGTFGRKDGTEQAIDLKFIKQDEAWKLIEIETKLADVTSDPLTLSVPEAPALVALAAQVTRDIGLGVRERSFKAVHASMARAAQAAITLEELDTAFAEMIEKQVDVGPAAEVEPEFDPLPMIDPEAMLVMAGRYHGHFAQVNFKYKFVRENDQWRLVGVNVHAVPTDGEGKVAGH